MPLSVLAITDGTTRVNLLAKTNGFHLSDWPPQPPTLKGGGVWNDSPLADGRELAVRKWTNATESITLSLNGGTQEQVIRNLQDLLRLLEKAADYWVTEWHNQPVWLEAVSSCETNKRYALVMGYGLTGESNPYAPPFAGDAPPAYEALSLSIEHGPWLSQPPGVGECVAASTTQASPFGFEVNTSLPASNVYDIIQLSTGRLLATDSAHVWRTDDGGATPWVDAAAPPPAGIQYAIEEDTTNNWIFILVAASVYRSVDGGANWVNRAANVGAAISFHNMAFRASDGYTYLADSRPAEKKVKRSNDGFATAATVLDVSPATPASVVIAGAYILVNTTTGTVWRSSNGTTWTVVGPSIAGGRLVYPGDGYLYKLPIGGTDLWRSSDFGDTWIKVATFPVAIGTSTANLAYLSGQGYRLTSSAATNTIWYSPNAIDWMKIYDDVAVHGCSFDSANNKVYVGRLGDIISSLLGATVGQEATCLPSNLLVNKSNLAQLTNILVYDAAPVTWTSEFPAGAFPFNLFPAVPAVGDILYIGSDPTNGGVFNNVVFNIAQTGAFTIVWEYSNGAGGWPALTCVDGTLGFVASGVHCLSFPSPSNWASEAANGITDFWIRARITAIPAAPITATQATRDIYTSVWSGLTIAASAVKGDIAALLEAWLTNASDSDGAAGGGTPDSWSNRIILGLRSASRGAYFQPFLNISDVQQPVGVSIAGTAATVAAADTTTATGRRYTHTGTGTSTWADQIIFTLSPTVASSFSGRFRIFLRAYQTNGVVGDVRFRAKIVHGSGGLSYIGDYALAPAIATWQLIDLGSFILPPSSQLKATDLGNQMQIVLQIWSSAARTVYLFDLALVPTDEWSADLVDGVLVAGSEVGAGQQMDVDSISNPKSILRALVRAAGSDTGYISSIYQPIASGPAILQSNAEQRLFVLCAKYQSGVWYSLPSTAHFAKLEAAFRYFSLRGNR